MTFDAVILAGGTSTRMGRDKAMLQIKGQTLLARQIELARQTGAGEVFISGRPERDDSAFGCRVLTDKYADAGPLAGIERGLGAASAPLLLVLAVDLPEINAGLLRRLLAACGPNQGLVPRLGPRIEPLAAFYPKSAHSLSAQLLARNAHAVTQFAEACVQAGLAKFADLLEDDSKYFVNWNTPTAVSDEMNPGLPPGNNPGL